jgi:two-component system NtrC family sensor kinase
VLTKERRVLYRTRSKLIVSFVGISMFVGLVSVYVGSQLLYKSVLSEAENRISLDLNAARGIYRTRVDVIATTLAVASLDGEFRDSLSRRDVDELAEKLRSVSQQSRLDFAGVVSPDGVVIRRLGPPAARPSGDGGGAPVDNPLVRHVLRGGEKASGTVLLGREFLLSENPLLADQARIDLIPTPMAASRDEKEETLGMAIGAAVPVLEGNRLVGVLYGGQLLNRSRDIVDTVRDTVFQNESFRGRSVGTATIFLKDARIATNVLTPAGERAVGTRVSRKVRDFVLIEGKRWTDRAFVVSDWYITAYEPIVDIFGERVGMLYVGVLESKYVEVRRKVITVFVLITVAGILVAIGTGSLLANMFLRPVRGLIAASREVSKGNFSPDLGPVAKDEIGVLQKTFSEMLHSIQERDKRQRAESEIRLLLSEKQASVGRLAAGVAHEINNPLTGVLTFTHMLLRRKDIDGEMKNDLSTIAKATERVRTIVKGLLDFSRQTMLEPEPTDVNELVGSSLKLVENNALVKGVKLSFMPMANLPVRKVDRSQMQSVILNIVMNALDATDSGGSILITTNIGYSASKTEEKGIEISVIDTGHGIPPENLERIFDPFFTTKEVGKGTGLGLSVSYGIVERHGGSIHVQSVVGKGSTFTIWLPLEDKGED